jgi:hypothetical protein
MQRDLLIIGRVRALAHLTQIGANPTLFEKVSSFITRVGDLGCGVGYFSLFHLSPRATSVGHLIILFGNTKRTRAILERVIINGKQLFDGDPDEFWNRSNAARDATSLPIRIQS